MNLKSKIKRRDKKVSRGGTSKATTWIMLTITLILGVILVPIVVNQVQNTSTDSWTFTGAQGAITLFKLLPFIFIVGIVVYFIASLLGKI
ncbi:MAG: hypothetical protein QXG39_06595 [Candidatus Aenigmatarchaeota archaeon]